MNVEPGSHVFILQSHQIRDSSSDSALHEEGVGNLFYLVSLTVTRIFRRGKKPHVMAILIFKSSVVSLCAADVLLFLIVFWQKWPCIFTFFLKKRSRTVELFKVWRILTTRIVKKSLRARRTSTKERERERASSPPEKNMLSNSRPLSCCARRL